MLILILVLVIVLISGSLISALFRVNYRWMMGYRGFLLFALALFAAIISGLLVVAIGVPVLIALFLTFGKASDALLGGSNWTPKIGERVKVRLDSGVLRGSIINIGSDDSNLTIETVLPGSQYSTSMIYPQARVRKTLW